MNYKRSDRIAAMIQEEVSKMLLYDLKDPAIGFVTITKVQVSPDLRHSKILYSVMGDEVKKEQSKAALDRALGHIRTELGNRLNIRFVPTVKFMYDDSVDYANHIESILQKLKEDKQEK